MTENLDEITKLVDRLVCAQEDMLYAEYVRKRSPSKTLMKEIGVVLKKLDGLGVALDNSRFGLD